MRGKGLVAIVWLGIAGVGIAAEPVTQLHGALAGGQPSLNLRLRYEAAEQDNALAAADAVTLRTRLGYTTARWNSLDLMVELEDVHALGSEDYNSCPGTGSPVFGDGCNGRAAFAVVADPEGTELNQFWLRYAGIAKTVLKYGRQRLALDNHRFIGNVGWRQNEMTFDGLSVVNTALPKLTINYAHLTNANNIFGGDFQLRGDLLNMAWAQSQRFKLTGYAYLVDFDVDVPARRDTRTYGLRASGALPLAQVKFLYALEYASQERHGDSPDSVDAGYKLVELGTAYKAVTGRLGYEVLGGDGTYGFQTPLATLHAFQGWADVFLNTPADGVRDAYLSLSAVVDKFSFLAVYHDFSADSGSADFGEEWDASVSRSINDHLSVMLKYADYNAKDLAVDTHKLWAQAEYTF